VQCNKVRPAQQDRVNREASTEVMIKKLLLARELGSGTLEVTCGTDEESIESAGRRC
jgi:hypothetical protein